MKAIKAVWHYLKPSWEGDDNKLSYRRASQFVFVVLVVKIVLTGFANIYQVYALLCILITFLLLAAIISADNIIECFRQVKGFGSFFKKSNEPLPPPGE